MSRRASLPGASELFRLTSSPTSTALDRPAAPAPAEPLPKKRADADQLSRAAAPSGSGRTKHDAKITVYVSGEELLAMEQTRLNLRAKHDLVVDRGRLVREAVAVLIADFDQRGDDSVLVQRLRANEDEGGTEG
ncbi:cobyrinic acid a,c-diamide synthase [Amycolatopsis sp. FDAARGOS 1241]|uniref:cobyrinic acid a,c-diamide synthase n=1 Tax=Amycolatopsis sp. FDAARGOS 1241 TaxID=2778070 RepID=UPI001951A66A|nr:cobyrinic acid a,c-diamide synthase [Amycolatopsis sp. FDAARGOS 1241]QRP48992.1 cobyrinic acid a,c-diamide synthase [Amycolatopsis sp. FDAARGOS 1241]